MKILIIERNDAHARTLGMVVQALGHKALVFTSPTEAIEAADAEGPDVILLGLSLRGLDVYEYTRILREQDHLQAVKILAVSGEVSDPQAAREAGIDTELVRSQSRNLLTVLRENFREVEEAHGYER
jgi:DNA-binding response OmpR family regulator